jgi:hypothetical protein
MFGLPDKRSSAVLDAKLFICITFPDKPGEVSMQIIGFKTWLRVGY